MSDLSPPERRAIHAATHMAYRPDIDGLRTVAVLPVVLNHAGVPGIWGGFVGVDIFFVISGYLITGILARDLVLGRHSIAEFYRRRVLRIFPALFAMLALTTLVACVAMLPGELTRYARSLGATTLFGSNLLFWSETGYFEPAARLKPLLHTWSLAIEEQFYIVWPLALAWIGAKRPAGMKALVLATTALSLGYAIWQVAHGPSTAFYLLPARAWELSLGAGLALIPQRPSARWVNEALGLLGLGLIGWAMRFYTEAAPFPGAAALLPCGGAALLILTGGAGTLAERALALAPMRFVGKISYSLYLWHWPVIVFAELALFLPRTLPVMAGEIVVSLVLATLSWRFVEQPFRVGVSGWRTPRVLAGDSHGAHFWPGLSRHASEAAILQATRTGCKPVLYPAGVGGACGAFFRTLLGTWLPAHRVDRLMLAARWRPGDASLVEATLRDPAVRAAHPLLVGPVPQYATALPRLLVFADKRGEPRLPARAHDAQVFETDRLLRAVAARTGTPYLSMVEHLCAPDGCRTWAARGVPMQFDYGHLTAQGSQVAVDGAVWPALGLGR